MHRLKTKKNPTGKTVAEMVNEAIERGDFDNLPGKGKPLDLEGYFSVDRDHQVSSQLLIDHKVIPPVLQDRKDVENLQSIAEENLQKEEQGLQRLRDEMVQISASIVSLFPDRETLMHVLGTDTWPVYFCEPSGEMKSKPRRLFKNVRLLQSRIIQHNNQAKRVVIEYMARLTKANERIKKLNTNLMEGPVVGGSRLQNRTIDLDGHKERVLQKCKPLNPLPHDIAERLQAYIHESFPTLWKRIFRGR